MENDNDQKGPQEVQKGAQTPKTIQDQIRREMRDARLKEYKSKVKTLIDQLEAARKVVSAKELEITALTEEYADLFPAS